MKNFSDCKTSLLSRTMVTNLEDVSLVEEFLVFRHISNLHELWLSKIVEMNEKKIYIYSPTLYQNSMTDND